MTNVGGIEVTLSANMVQFAKTLERAQKQLREFGKQAEKTLGVHIARRATPAMTRYARQSSIALKKIQKEVSTIRPSIDRATAGLGKFNGQLRMAETQAQRTGAAIQRGFGKMGSAAWLKERMIWFVQLRLAWEAWHALGAAVRNVAVFEEALHNLKAVTNATTEEMNMMEAAIRDAATQTKFFASDMSKAAVTLGQAGFSAREITKILPDIALLASAANRGLEETSQVISTVMRTWNLEANESREVANLLAAGISKSRLQIEDFNEGLQYVGVTAKQFGISVESVVAWMGILRNVGYKAGSAMTALRRIFSVLSKPTTQFKDMLAKVGLTFDQVSLANVGFNESLKRMGDAGLNVADIFGAVQREGQAF